MIAEKSYIEELCEEFEICDYTARETPPEAFIKWYQDHKDEAIDGIALKEFDVLSIMDFFEDDLSCMYED